VTIELSRKEAIEFLNIPEKNFNNYFKNSNEIKGRKVNSRWFFNKDHLIEWNKLRKKRTVYLSIKEYEKCFEFAIKMAYITKASHGTGIRGARSEVQMADDFILGILAEHGVKKFLKKKFSTTVKLDMEVHPDYITPQDFIAVKPRTKWRKLKIGVAVKSSKFKNCYNIIPPIEYQNRDRKSDIYIFVRVGLPSDHLFRILKGHSFFKKVADYLKKTKGFRAIETLDKVPIWICGFSYHRELKRVSSIPGQEFNGYRYVKGVAEMHNSDKDWKQLVRRF